ncbi:MAG TPA: CatB-related O-acetyltransferase [Candidatus Caccousia avistercoris]|nr:CatB-related O-acetyltransferase [Candidatus Caccousia avistercoris]
MWRITALIRSKPIGFPRSDRRGEEHGPEEDISAQRRPGNGVEEWGLRKEDVAEAWDRRGDIFVGSDVWIGYEAVIMAGVTVGDGAVVGARALVTRDVPPYAVVGGVPARVIRKRFPEETVKKLLALQWWNWPEEKIKRHIREIQTGQAEKLLSAGEGE